MSEHFQYLKEGLVADLVDRKLSDPATALYKEGPAYIYSYLKDELGRGKL